jgi:predicted AlkP superfamily pyrophosphatase or phosphodiesterase
VGVEAPYEGGFPTNYLLYDVNRSRKELADSVLAALCNPNVEEIPNLTMWYFDEPDAVEHRYSPTSDETRKVVEEIDDVLAYFMTEVRKSPVYDKINFIFTGDHGMTELDPDKYYNIYDLIPGKIRYYFNSNPVTLEPYDKDPKAIYDILKAHEEEGHYRVWLREEMPAEYHYGTYTDRIQPIILLADNGWKVVYNKEEGRGKPKPKSSSHGFDPNHPDMQMAFFACGPAFKSGYTHDVTFQNLNDHLIISYILGIDPAENNDCVWEDIEGLFK